MIFNYKNTRFFVFSDTHRFHKCIDIPQDIDVVICLGDAVEDNLNPQDYARFLDWYATQPGKKFFLPGNHELIFEIAPKWGERLFKSDAIKLCLDTIEIINGITLHFHYSADSIHLKCDTDLLLTHYPPEMCDYIGEIRPVYHLYGHDHDTEGKRYEEAGTIFCNVSCYNSCYQKAKAGVQKAIERVRAKRDIKTKTYNEFRNNVYERAMIKFGHLADEVKQRLDIELAAIEKYDSTATLICMQRLFNELSQNNICSQLRIYNRYGISLVCYVLGISLFNPLGHSTIDTESIALEAFRYCHQFDFSIDRNAYKLIKQWLKKWGYTFEIEATDNVSSMIMNLKIDTDKIVQTHIRHRPSACKHRRAICTFGDRLFDDIPLDDECTFETIYNLDLYGTTTACFSPITLEALRLCKPASLNELATALSFTKEEQYKDLMNYISNRDINRENKFVEYIEAYNLYTLAYIKKYYPEYFDKVLTYK